MANIKVFISFGNIKRIMTCFFYLIKDIFVFILARVIPVKINFPKAKRLNQQKCYILADKRIGSLEGGVIEFE